MAAGELAADALREEDKNARKPPGLMTKFKHAVTPPPKTPQARAQAVLRELQKLKQRGPEHEDPDYPYVDKLLKAGVEGHPEDIYKIGETLVCQRKSDLAKTLLSSAKDFPVDHPGGKHKQTLLHLSVLLADFGVTRRLLDMGADVNAKTPGGNTALDIAMRRGWSISATMLSDMLTPLGAERGDKTAPVAEAKIEEKWRGDMREQIQDIVELDNPVSRPRTASFSKKPGSAP